MFTGNKTSGGNVLLTISKGVQEKAYDDLVHNTKGAKNGAAVAIDPGNGAILALASMPSYDPNPLASTTARPRRTCTTSSTSRSRASRC